MTNAEIRASYAAARKAYAALGVDTDAAIKKALAVPLSLHCWQADDCAGLETKAGVTAGGGIMATGNYPGRARTGDELRQDYERVLSLIPGTHRLNLHASYAETGGAVVDRDALQPKHFARWIAWAKEQKIGLDFNSTFFAHPLANSGFTLSHPDRKVREFWIRHAIACRKIAVAMARALRQPVVLNHWLPDGCKDSPADRWSPRQRLVESFDAIFSPKLGINRQLCMDAVEGKLFGLGSEDYVVGSNEFYNLYAITRGVVPCLDMGHFHPTETIADKISALLQFHNRILLHISRPVRWDSDHVVLFNDDVRAVFQELVRGKALDRAIIATDFFDASINRIAAYVIGARATRKAMLSALVEPVKLIQRAEAAGQHARKLALMEEAKTLPFAAVWDMLCLKAGVPVGSGWISVVEQYEAEVLAKRQ